MRIYRLQRPIVVAAVLVLPASALLLGPGAASAQSEPSCQVTNVTAATAPVPAMQLALDAASPGDHLQVSGVCVGPATVTKSVALAGVPTDAYPMPTLDGESAAPVLTLLGQKDAKIEVTISDLTIQHGHASVYGGGISSRRADLVLGGTTEVIANEAWYGGGVSFTLGTLVLQDDAAVLENRMDGIGGWGGGLYLRRGALTVTDRAVVAGNSAATGGGIATYKATVLIDAQSSVEGSHASNGGGGIFTYDAPVTVRGDAVLRGNDAATYGGGVYLGGYRPGYVRLTVGGNASVVDNASSLYGGGIAESGHAVVSLKASAQVVGNHANLGGGIHSAGRLRLLDAASVTLNTATAVGGGLFNEGVVVLKPGWTGTLCGNDPDDWPGCAT